MSSFNPNCFWTYNCGAKDYDFFATWGNLTVQRNNLQYIRISLYYWNEIDGWKTKSQTFIPPNAPTSDPFTFNAQIIHSWCKGIQNCYQNYFGKQYKFSTLVEIIYGGNGHNLVIDEYFFDSNSVSTNLKYCKTDQFYNETHPSCTDELPNC